LVHHHFGERKEGYYAERQKIWVVGTSHHGHFWLAVRSLLPYAYSNTNTHTHTHTDAHPNANRPVL